jgi:hypothetical protein
MAKGCGSGGTDAVIADIVQENVIFTVNGAGKSVTFSLTGYTPELLNDRNVSAHLLAGYDSYEVSYDPADGKNNAVLFEGGSVYLYAAATCEAETGELNHEVNTNKVNIVNLSATDYLPSSSTSIVVTQADMTTTHSVTETVGKCAVTGTSSLNGVVVENGMTITVTLNGVTDINYTVSGVDAALIALGDTLKADVVIFDDNSIMLVPMAGYDDLLAIKSLEKCNGIDDDLDGQTDEDNVCAAAEICNGIDDDLDGLTDEDNVCAATEICNGIDDDLDGQTDEELAELCTQQAGVCAGSTTVCSGGAWQACSASDYGADYEAEETTCDGLDNDCDGLTDEGNICGSAEICNGIDDDLDGQTDEELAALCTQQAGVCAGSTTVCSGGAWQACSASDYGVNYETEETMCDGLDNDCDGVTDESCP